MPLRVTPRRARAHRGRDGPALPQPGGLNADGLSGEEGTFAVCTFWLVSALAKAGEVEHAEALFEQPVGHANDLGLLGEEIDTAKGKQLGNFPQGYSHIGFITAAYEIDQARAAQSS